MNIEDRMLRANEEDRVILGNIVESLAKTDGWKVIRAVTEGRRVMEIANAKNGTLNSDRILGRIEAYETIMSDLEQFVKDRDDLQRPVNTERQLAQDHSDEVTDYHDIREVGNTASFGRGGAI